MVFFLYVDGIYAREGKILLVKRNSKPFKGFWHVIGGQVRDNESLEEALKREFKEETDLEVEVGHAIDWRIEQSFDRTKIVIIFEVPFASGEVKLNCESIQYGWFDKTPPHSVYDYSKYLGESH